MGSGTLGSWGLANSGTLGPGGSAAIGCGGRQVAIPLVLDQWGLVRRSPLEMVLGQYLEAAERVLPLVLAQLGSLLAVASLFEVAAGEVRVVVGYASAVEVEKAWAAEARAAEAMPAAWRAAGPTAECVPEALDGV